MTSMSVDGLVSGLDTTSLINSLMQAEAAPQTALKNKVTATQTDISAYQSINAKLAAIKTSTDVLAKAATWSTPAATSSSTRVAATSTATASTGQVTFDVTATARSHSLATAEFSTLSDVADQMPPVITVNKGGQVVTLNPSGGSLDDVVKSINDATSLGLTASAIQVAPGRYRLQVSAKDTGDASSFTVGGLGTTSTVRQGRDASVDLGGGLVVRSATNTFKDLLPGTTFTVSAEETGVTVTVAKDKASLADKVQGFVDATNAALAEMKKQSSYNVASKSGGTLVGDSTVRRIQQSLAENVSSAVGANGSPAVAGIQVSRDGTITFDRAKFLALADSDPAKAQALVQGVTNRVGTVADRATDKTTGSLTSVIEGRTSLVTDLNKRIEAWDGRLAMRRTTLRNQFTAMETALSSMKNQSSWLAGQVNSLAS